MAGAASLMITTLALAAGAPPGQPPIDPLLPDAIREVVTQASKAELDPKRGTNNAVEILKAEKARVAESKPDLGIALNLRVAATMLRQKFLSADEFALPQRYQQALSTYSRLDLTEPGLPEWVDRTLAANPEVAKKLGKRAGWKVKAAILTRSVSLDKDAVARAFAAALEKAGVKLELVPAKDAPLILTLGAEDVPRQAQGDSAVKVTLQMERIQNAKIAWKGSLFRVEAAKDPQVALTSALNWLARIGGRDLFFDWLGEQGLQHLADPTPKKPGHQHQHGSH